MQTGASYSTVHVHPCMTVHEFSRICVIDILWRNKRCTEEKTPVTRSYTHGPPKLLVVNFSINLRCYVLLGCRVINVILAINIGDSAFFDIAALVRQFGGLRHHQQTESIDRLRRYLFRKSTLSPFIKLLASDMYIMVTHGITLSYD